MQDSRYLIYWLLRKQVEVKAHTGRRLTGMVERVYRDVMDGKVEFTVSGHRVSFAEPNVILKDGDDVVFVYGSVQLRNEETDEELFRAARYASQSGESIDEMLRRTEAHLRHETRFMVKPPEPALA